jgi:hypothetical protein
MLHSYNAFSELHFVTYLIYKTCGTYFISYRSQNINIPRSFHSLLFANGVIYCDVHAVVLFRGSKGRYLVTTRHGTIDVSLESVPRSVFSTVCPQAIYLGQWGSKVESSEELCIASDAIRVDCSSGCRVELRVRQSSEKSQGSELGV